VTMERIAIIMGKMVTGGKKNLVMEYYRHIDRTEIQFDFICDSDSDSIPKDEIEALGGRWYEIPPYQDILSNMRQLRIICKKNNYRAMHAYNGTMNLFPLAVAWQCRIPIRINESISMGNKLEKKNILKMILRPFSKCFATHFLANGEVCGRWQFGNRLFDSGKVDVFKTIINVEDNRYDEQLRAKTRKMLAVEDNIVVGHIGRLTAQKNTLFIIDIFNEVLLKEPKAKLLVIGDGNLRQAMLDRIAQYGIESSVIYLGRTEDIQQYYNAMDCFLLPSLYEGLPVAGVEAQNCGLPVFFSEEIPKESSACDDLGCFISLEKNADVWADEILNKTKANMKNRKGREHEITVAGFNSEVEADKLTSYYKKILDNLKQ